MSDIDFKARYKRAKRSKFPKPIEQGSLKLISDLFIAPLLKYKPPSRSLSAWLGDIFCVDTRSIERYVTTKRLVIRGNLYRLASRPVQGIGYNEVAKDTVVFVRIDETKPDFVDVEVYAGQGQKEQVFQVDAYHYKTEVKPYLAPAPKAHRIDWIGKREGRDD